MVAPELHEAMAQTARRNVAANGLSSKVSVVERDIGLLERGVEIRRKVTTNILFHISPRTLMVRIF